MKSYSQAGQDRFVWEILNHKPDGNFLDIGCHDGHKHSNTLGLEQRGWRGLLLDIQGAPGITSRKSTFVKLDAVTADWAWILISCFREECREIDYLSLDVDEATTATLVRLIEQPMRYRVITVEHDLYRLGPSNAIKQRGILADLDYELMCKNVCVGPGDWGKGGPYEDWWVCKELMTEDNCRRFLCDGQLGTSIVPE